jgi:hypothetical protein
LFNGEEGFMSKLGNLFLNIGVIFFILGGIAVITNIISKNSPVVPVLAALALIFIGAGASIKKKWTSRFF